MSVRKVYINSSTIWVSILLFLAVSLHFLFLKLSWPGPNADEAIIDLMARHIAYQGDHPTFFWGQHYMGSIQAYLGALGILLFGSSTNSVRLGTLLIFALYLVAMYRLVRLLYTPVYALFIIALLSIGSDRTISVPLIANGGYAETMLFGTLIFLLVTRLALTKQPQGEKISRSRLLTYAALGVVIGLGLWSDQLILSAIVAGGAMLLFCCWREIRGWVLVVGILGIVIGALPLVIYNLAPDPGQSALAILFGTVFSGNPRIIPLTEQFAHVLFIAWPMATGLPFAGGVHGVCGTIEPYQQATSSLAGLFPSTKDNPWFCLATPGSWSVI